MKKLLYTALFLLLTALLLRYPAECLALALIGLDLWFQKMVPTLLPFMILSGIMIRMELTEKIVFLLRPLLGLLFRLRATLLFAIVVGFLCGFPMGARVVADLYTRRKITKGEADYLLAFCNNIGPIYFTGFALPMLGLSAVTWGKTVPYLMGMYGLPLLYGILLRFTVYRRRLSGHLLYPELSPDLSAGELSSAEWSHLKPLSSKMSVLNRYFKKLSNIRFTEIPLAQTPLPKIVTVKIRPESPPAMGLPEALDESITAGMESITKLGGYMIFFNLLNIFPRVLWPDNPAVAALGGCFLEITGGIRQANGNEPIIVLVLLSFGGLSCLAQTNSCIRHTDLSIRTYVLHKLILTALAFLYYRLLF